LSNAEVMELRSLVPLHFNLLSACNYYKTRSMVVGCVLLEILSRHCVADSRRMVSMSFIHLPFTAWYSSMPLCQNISQPTSVCFCNELLLFCIIYCNVYQVGCSC